MKTNFHKKDFARRLALKRRQTGTRKWPIYYYPSQSEAIIKRHYHKWSVTVLGAWRTAETSVYSIWRQIILKNTRNHQSLITIKYDNNENVQQISLNRYVIGKDLKYTKTDTRNRQRLIQSSKKWQTTKNIVHENTGRQIDKSQEMKKNKLQHNDK